MDRTSGSPGPENHGRPADQHLEGNHARGFRSARDRPSRPPARPGTDLCQFGECAGMSALPASSGNRKANSSKRPAADICGPPALSERVLDAVTRRQAQHVPDWGRVLERRARARRSSSYPRPPSAVHGWRACCCRVRSTSGTTRPGQPAQGPAQRAARPGAFAAPPRPRTRHPGLGTIRISCGVSTLYVLTSVRVAYGYTSSHLLMAATTRTAWPAWPGPGPRRCASPRQQERSPPQARRCRRRELGKLIVGVICSRVPPRLATPGPVRACAARARPRRTSRTPGSTGSRPTPESRTARTG